MQRTIFHDRERDRLVFLNVAPDQEYWDALWSSGLSRKNILRGDRFVTAETRRVLPAGSRVLDAGCGIAATVSGLADAGYRAEGIDYAETTVAAVNRLAPELAVRLGNVLALDYADGALDGLWSLGVIEHFHEGFGPVIAEARRVLRSEGFLFLTVPVISPLKSLKAARGAYPAYRKEHRDRFFQFAFRRDHVVAEVERAGFRLLRDYGRSGSFGLTEDAPVFTRRIGLTPDPVSLAARVWWRLLDHLLVPVSFHTRFFLFQRL